MLLPRIVFKAEIVTDQLKQQVNFDNHNTSFPYSSSSTHVHMASIPASVVWYTYMYKRNVHV